MNRISSIDFMRGLVMVIMALDHTRDFMHVDALTAQPLNLQTTNTWLFGTRWVTHLCAPAFVFLSGASAWLSFQRRGNINDARRFLFTRGLWLLFLEFTIINFAIFFNIRFEILMSQVIAAIGFGMIVLSLLLRLSPRAIGIIGLVIIFGHNLVASVNFEQGTALTYIWGSLFKLSFFQVSPKFTLFVLYPLIPWFGVLLAGYGFAPFFAREIQRRRKVLLYTGIGVLALFAMLRFLNIYGDPSAWATQKTSLFSFLSFINVTKNPPSLLFVLVTIGISLIIMSTVEGKRNRMIDFFSVYGKVPLFYYLVHWYILHGTLLAILFIQGFSWEQFNFSPFQFGRPEKVSSGVSLTGVYLIWICVVLLLYPVCKWYGRYKQKHKEKRWLNYL